MKCWSWNIKRQFTVGHVWKMPLPARSCCVSSVHRGFFLALLKLSCQQGINWKGFNYSLSTLHQGCPGFLTLQATSEPPKQACAALHRTADIPACCPRWEMTQLRALPHLPALHWQFQTESGCWVPSSSGLPDLAAHTGSWGWTPKSQQRSWILQVWSQHYGNNLILTGNNE